MNTIMTPDGNRDEIIPGKPVHITIEQLKAICPNAPKNVDVFIPYLNDTLEKYDITTPNRKAAFIAQVAHESGSFRYVREQGGAKYLDKYDTGKLAKALGNTPEDDDDGAFYSGKGLIQCTGKANYAECSKALFGDINVLLKNPSLLETPQYATLSAGWYWNKKDLNKFADLPDEWRSLTKKYTPFQYITYKINGGQNGLSDRLAYYERARQVF
jgi:putative chitinase